MVTDAQVRIVMSQMLAGATVAQAAMKANMSPRTAGKYLRLGKVPSQSRKPRTWRTREDPFDAEDLEWTFQALAAAPELEAKAMFDYLQERWPDRYAEGQLRSYQRRIERWRAQRGPEREVYFTQVHRPGEAAQTDFTDVTELGVTAAGVPVPKLLCHTVLPFSNATCATVCHSESAQAMRDGVQRAFFGWGHVPTFHQTDSSSSATRRMGPEDIQERPFTDSYLALMRHLGMQPRRTQVGEPHQNGDVESGNGALKRSLKQHLLLRGSAAFDSVEAWQAFVDEVVARRNKRCGERLATELAHMRPLTVGPLASYVEHDVVVPRTALVAWKGNAYSVPSRLIGETVQLRVSEAQVEVWYGGELQVTAERQLGRGHSAINYRHLIGSLVVKPAAFARFRHRDALFPSLVFRAAFDALEADLGASVATDLEYLRILHLAAYTSEADVEAALTLLMGQLAVPRVEAVRDLAQPARPIVPDVTIGTPDPAGYDRLIGSAA